MILKLFQCFISHVTIDSCYVRSKTW